MQVEAGEAAAPGGGRRGRGAKGAAEAPREEASAEEGAREEAEAAAPGRGRRRRGRKMRNAEDILQEDASTEAEEGIQEEAAEEAAPPPRKKKRKKPQKPPPEPSCETTTRENDAWKPKPSRLDMEGIFFRQDAHYQAYRVNWFEDGQKKYKNFSPTLYGGLNAKGKRKALEAAQAFRELLRRKGLLRSRNQQNCAAWPPSNVRGVRWHRSVHAWFASIQVNGKVLGKYFKVMLPVEDEKKAIEEARRDAIAYRYQLQLQYSRA